MIDLFYLISCHYYPFIQIRKLKLRKIHDLSKITLQVRGRKTCLRTQTTGGNRAGPESQGQTPSPRRWLHRSHKHLGPCHAVFASVVPQSWGVASWPFCMTGIQKPKVLEYSVDPPPSIWCYFVFLVHWQKISQKPAALAKAPG